MTDPARAQDTFVREFEAAGPALLAWARLRIRPELRARLEPDDLVQEVGCRAWAQIDRFDPALGSFRRWLFGFANRVLLEALRDLGRARPDGAAPRTQPAGVSEIAASVTSVTRKVAREEVVRLFLSRIDALEGEDRDLLLHRGLEGLSHPETATLLGIGEDAVRKRWQRLCERMRDDPVFRSLVAA